MQGELKITRRHLPHWELQGSTYFISFRTARGFLNATEQQIVMNILKNGHPKFYILISAMIMPDHVHLLLTPQKNYSLSGIMKGIKGTASRQINIDRESKGNIWQAESFDRIIRSQSDFEKKLNYMWNNPIKMGLAENPHDYPGWYFDERFEDYVLK